MIRLPKPALSVACRSKLKPPVIRKVFYFSLDNGNLKTWTRLRHLHLNKIQRFPEIWLKVYTVIEPVMYKTILFEKINVTPTCTLL